MPLISGDKPQEYILVWSGDEPKEITALGQPIVVPPVHEVAVAGQGRYRYGSAKDATGNPIPGTVAITDQYTNKDGAAVRVFDAYEWCITVEQNKKGLFQMGYDQTRDAEQVKSIQEKGRTFYDKAMAKRDEQIILHARQQAEWYKSKGIKQAESTQDDAVRAAVARQAQRRKDGRLKDSQPVSIEELDKALGVAPKAAAEPTPAPSANESELDVAAQALFRAARSAKLRLKDDEVAGLVERNPDIMQKVSDRIEAAEAASPA